MKWIKRSKSSSLLEIIVERTRMTKKELESDTGAYEYPGIAEAAPPNSVAEVVAQNANSYSLDFDAGKNYTEETLTLNGQAAGVRSHETGRSKAIQ